MTVDDFKSSQSTDLDRNTSNRIASAQMPLFAYVVALVRNPDVAHDIVQEVNLVLWDKRADYDPTRDYLTWAKGVARTAVLAHRRDFARDRLVFSGDLLERIADQAIAEPEPIDARRSALHHCMSLLTHRQQELVRLRYAHGGSVVGLADQFGRPVASISTSLLRIRKSLAECIDGRMAREEVRDAH